MIIGRMFTLFLLIGWSIGGVITSEAEFSEVVSESVITFQEFESGKTGHWALILGIDYMVEGFGIAAIGFLAFGVFIYSLFPVPVEFIMPIFLFFVFDLILFGLLSYFLINGLFVLLFLGIEKTGLINWGERFETRR